MSRNHLLLSIHDVTPSTVGRVERLHAHLSKHGQARAMALLVVPEHWDSRPIAHDPSFKAWLRARHSGGDEIILHGFTHRDEEVAQSWVSHFKGRRMTAGEGEFLSLSAAAAVRRIEDGRALLEDIIGAAVPGFIAPAWLYGAGAHVALTRTGTVFAEDHFRVWRPPTADVVARGPVITWASRSGPRIASSLAFAAAARRLLRSLPAVRIGVHPGDTGQSAIMDSIARTAAHFRASHQPISYAELAKGSGGGASMAASTAGKD